jgi:hypothetical protein
MQKSCQRCGRYRASGTISRFYRQIIQFPLGILWAVQRIFPFCAEGSVIFVEYFQGCCLKTAAGLGAVPGDFAAHF